MALFVLSLALLAASVTTSAERSPLQKLTGLRAARAGSLTNRPVATIITALSANTSAYASVINVTENPFFNDEGYPFITFPPKDLMAELTQAGCRYAWQRKWHQQSALDATCNAIIAPFVKSSPGAPLGLYATCLSYGLINDLDGYYGPDNYESDPLMMLPDLLVEHSDGIVRPSLENLTWVAKVPAILLPIAGYRKAELIEMEEQGSLVVQKLVHAAGRWTMNYQLDNEQETGTEEQLMQYAEWGMQLWKVLGEANICDDVDGHCGAMADAELKVQLGISNTSFGVTWLRHAGHAIVWTTVDALLERGVPRFQRPSTALIDSVIDAVCNGLVTIEFETREYCFHGLGHALTWYALGFRTDKLQCGARGLRIAQARLVCVH